MNIVSGEQIAKAFQVGNEKHPVLLDVSVTVSQGSLFPLWAHQAVVNQHCCMPLAGWTVLIKVRSSLMEWI